MTTYTFRRLAPASAIVIAALLSPASPLSAAPPSLATPLGVVVFSQGAQISQISAANGTSLYARDVLSTDASGSLRVRFGNSQLMLGPLTVVKLDQADRGVAAILQQGTIRFTSAANPLELRVLDGVFIRPVGEGASGQLRVVSANEFQIAATKGNLEVEIDGVKRIVAESTAFDVTLQPMSFDPDAEHPGKRRRKALWIIIPAILITTAVGLYFATLSCSKF